MWLAGTEPREGAADLRVRAYFIFAIGDVGGRARSWCRPRPCEFVGWVLVDAALWSDIALLQLLVVGVLNTFLLLCNCGAMLQHFTCTNAACQQALV